MHQVYRAALLLALLAGCATAPAAAGPCRNVILVTADGLRWQELLGGADEALLDKASGGVEDVAAVRQAFWRETPHARREALLPFVWSVLARQGRLWAQGRVTNGLNFSYPGYQELLAGFPDPKVDSNKKIPNENVTVLEWLNGRPGFEGRVAAFCSWDVFPYILNRERSGIVVNIGEASPESPAILNALKAEIPAPWKGSIHDALTFHPALDYLKARRPRVLYVALGETDEWAHAGRYDRYLEAARRVDGYLRVLWETVQSMPEYRGTTALVFTTDHGRGDAPVEWKSHGEKVKGAERIWAVVMGPGVPPGGERPDAFTQSQIAATVAALVGEDYPAAQPKAAPPLR